MVQDRSQPIHHRVKFIGAEPTERLLIILERCCEGKDLACDRS